MQDGTKTAMDIETFEDDLLGLKEFSEKLGKFIKTEHRYVEGSLVIALSSKYGSGKSAFLRMWKSSLKGEDGSPLVISLNAWESDYFGDPLFAIISELAASQDPESDPAKKIINAVKDFGWFATAVGGQIVKKATGVDAVAAGKLPEVKQAKRNEGLKTTGDTFSVYEGRKRAMNSLKDAIQELVGGDKPRVLFLVDELDRCRPDYAISYLETIKHIFDIQGVVFLLAADRQQLENSARMAFGKDLDFDEYYRKFIHREISLPELTNENYKSLADKYVHFYLKGEGDRKCATELGQYREKYIKELISGLKLTPRQIQEVFRMLGHLFEAQDHEKEGKLLWCISVGSILMAALKIGNDKAYRSIGVEKLEPIEAKKILTDITGSKQVSWWFTLILSGGGLKIKDGQEYKDVMVQAGLLEEGQQMTDTSQWSQGWGHESSDRFSQIYDKLERLAQWV
tara:strand:+ start:913 stop:2277 length:1365 start_codon:yes stop_codon:yes gene_type:complete